MMTLKMMTLRIKVIMKVMLPVLIMMMKMIMIFRMKMMIMATMMIMMMMVVTMIMKIMVLVVEPHSWRAPRGRARGCTRRHASMSQSAGNNKKEI